MHELIYTCSTHTHTRARAHVHTNSYTIHTRCTHEQLDSDCLRSADPGGLRMKHCINRECTGCIIGTRSKFSFHINVFQTCVVSFFFSLNRQLFFPCPGICSFSTVFRSCLMIDLGCETDGCNEICLNRCLCLPCAYSFSIIFV